jgi:uncharacterized protein (TIGR00730 family)
VATLNSVCVFCGSSTPIDPSFRHAAVDLAGAIAARRLDLVYGGGSVGLMGDLADAALARGVRVLGVIPVGLFSREVGHPGLTELREVSSMHERKRLMYDLADGFVALPGGLGTLEELAEVATWTQLGLHAKAVSLLDVDGFWEPFTGLLDHMVEVGLLKQENRDIIRLAGTADQALDALESPPALIRRLIGDEER